jgi:hypothetical protein
MIISVFSTADRLQAWWLWNFCLTSLIENQNKIIIIEAVMFSKYPVIFGKISDIGVQVWGVNVKYCLVTL